MTFPLEQLSAAVTARAATWARLAMLWHARPVEPNHGKPVVSCEFEPAAWLAEIMIWCTGEAELATVRLTDDRIVNKHYDLASPGDLEILIDEFIALLVDDRLPDAAIVARPPRTHTAGQAHLAGAHPGVTDDLFAVDRDQIAPDRDRRPGAPEARARPNAT